MMRGSIPSIVMLVGLLLPSSLWRGPVAAAAVPGETIADAARKVVKLYGAGGVRGLEAFPSGILVSPDGRIVTVMSTVLDADEIDCVLDDGRRYPAGEFVGTGDRPMLCNLSSAVLREDATGFEVRDHRGRVVARSRFA